MLQAKYRTVQVMFYPLCKKRGWKGHVIVLTYIYIKKKNLKGSSKEIQPIHPKGDQSWVFTGRTDAEAQTPILWPPDAKS